MVGRVENTGALKLAGAIISDASIKNFKQVTHVHTLSTNF